MLSYIKGTLIVKTPMKIVLDCNNIGYEIRVPLSTFEKIGVLKSEVVLNVHLSVTDDDMKLYGFYTQEEKELFLRVISVSGIGPKIALSILSTMSVTGFIRNIKTENENALTIVPGLGKKTAQRLILELKDKLSSFEIIDGGISSDYASELLRFEAESALITLGYKQSDIREAFDSLGNKEQFSSSEELIKKTIQHLYRNRQTGKKSKN